MILKHWRELIFGAFCVVTFIQILYYAGFFSRLAFYKPRPKFHNEQRPVSVIICARDEADNIVKNLPGVLVQNYPSSHEVIMVNDNSSDDTKYLLDELRKTFKNLNPLQLTQEAKLMAGKKFPLSMGIRSAKYETLLLTDADCIPASENWMHLMQNGYRPETEIVLGYGAYEKSSTFLNKLIRFETFHSALQYLSYALAGIPYMGVGRNLSYKKDVFLRNKGFANTNNIPGGDDDLFINKVANKKNTGIVIDHEAHTLSAAKETWEEWYAQKNRHYSTAKYYKGKHKFLLGLYSATQFLFYPLAVLAVIVFKWWIALLVFAVKIVCQAFIYFKSMKKLNESDLFPMFILFDLWMCVYYVLFLPSIFKKEKRTWN
jgi:cellulose synthase/poly-beta-1,6-N-acetylglucosamine synthase-like glycosyltransferase